MVELKSTMVVALAVLAAFAMGTPGAAEPERKNSTQDFTSDVKALGKGVKDAAVEVGHQVGSGTKKAYRSVKNKIKKDVKDGKPGDRTIAKKNETAATATQGHR